MIEVELPDGTIVEFPEGTSQETMRRALKRNSRMSVGEQAAALLNKGGEALTLGLVGDEAAAAFDVLLGRGSYKDRLQFYRDQEEQIERERPGLSLAAEIAPAMVPGMGIASAARGGRLLTRAAKAGTAGAAGGAAYGFAEGEGGAENRISDATTTGAIAGGISAGVPVAGSLARAVTKPGRERAARRALEASTPSAKSLSDKATAIYKNGRQLSGSAPKSEVKEIKGQVLGVLAENGMVNGKGRVVGAFPKAKAAYKMLRSFKEMNPAQMANVRNSIQAAARSQDPQEARIGTLMLNEFTDFVEQYVPEFKHANRLYAAAKRSERIQQTIDLAGSQAGQFTGSGFENALRKEFRALEKSIIRGKEKGFSPDEVAMITKIARGDGIANFARNVGKAAPTGVVSASLGGGLPLMAGVVSGNPALGVAVGGGIAGAGMLGRKVATGIQSNRADMLELMTRTPNRQMPEIAPSLSADRLESGLMGLILGAQN